MVDAPVYVGLTPSASAESFSCQSADCLRSPMAGDCSTQDVDLERQITINPIGLRCVLIIG